MTDFFVSPGMTAMTIAVGSVEIIALIVMVVLLFEYCHIHSKRMELLRSLDGNRLTHAVWERRLIMIVYSVITLSIVFATSYLYIFQPHIL